MRRSLAIAGIIVSLSGLAPGAEPAPAQETAPPGVGAGKDAAAHGDTPRAGKSGSATDLPDGPALIEAIRARYRSRTPLRADLELTSVVFGHFHATKGRVVYRAQDPDAPTTTGYAEVSVLGDDGDPVLVEVREGDRHFAKRPGERKVDRLVAHPLESPFLVALGALHTERAVVVGRTEAPRLLVLEAPLLDPRPPFTTARLRVAPDDAHVVALELLDEEGDPLVTAVVTGESAETGPSLAPPRKEPHRSGAKAPARRTAE